MNFINRINLSKLILPLIIVDLALIPMLHAGGVPWKISLVLIVGIGLFRVPQNRFAVVRNAAPIVILGSVLVVTSIVGAIAHWYVTGATPGSDSLRLLMIFALIPLSFIVGFADRPQSHVYIGWVLVAMVGLNFAFFTAPDTLSSLANFYYLDQAYESFAYDPNSRYARPAGIFLNANVSALAITVLLTYVVSGLKWGFFRTNPFLTVFFLAAGLSGILMLFSRTQIVMGGLLIVVALFWSPIRQKKVFVSVTVAASILLAVVVNASPSFTESALGFDLGDRIRYQFSAVISGTLDSVSDEPVQTDEYKVSNSSIFLRPFRNSENAFDRLSDPQWMWLVGTGPEESAVHGPLLYHNDWLSVLVSGGLVAIVAYTVLVIYFGSISLVLALPFFLPGMVNGFLVSPQFVVLIAILGGIILRRKLDARANAVHGIDVTYVTVDQGVSIDNSPVLRSQILDAASSLHTGGLRTGLVANVRNIDAARTLAEQRGFVDMQMVSNTRLPLLIIKAAWRLNRMNRRHSIRSVYVRGIWGAIVYNLAFPLIKGPKLTYDFRADIVAESRWGGTRGLRHWVLRVLAQLTIRSADSHQAVSNAGARKLKRAYGAGSVLVIPSSTDVSKFENAVKSRTELRKKLGFSASDVVCVYSGGLALYQMIPEMLGVWRGLDRPGVKFMLITHSKPGHNVQVAELESLWPAGTTVLSLDAGEVATYLAAADIGFLLREVHPLNAVASPVKFAEYLAAGLAVVTSPGLEDASSLVEEQELGIVMSPEQMAGTADGTTLGEMRSLEEFVSGFPEERDQISDRAVRLAWGRYDWGAHLDSTRRVIFPEDLTKSETVEDAQIPIVE